MLHCWRAARLRWSELTDGVLFKTPSKTRRHEKTVQVPLHHKLARYLGSLERRGEFVFPELARTYSARSTARRFARACRAAGISHDGITFHSLRHTFVTRLKEAGVPEDVRRQLVGHSNAATHDRYDHSTGPAQAAIDALR